METTKGTKKHEMKALAALGYNSLIFVNFRVFRGSCLSFAQAR